MSRLARINQYRAALWREFSLFFLTGFILLLVAVVVDYSLKTDGVLADHKVDQQLAIVRARSMVLRQLEAVVSDIRLLRNAGERLAFFDEDSTTAHRRLKEIFQAYNVEKPVYDQIRFISTSGRELVRVNRGGEGPLIVAPEHLQDKADRYYVKAGLSLDPGEVYVSRLDLNVERGEVEVPFNPTLRLVTPVFSHDRRRRGMLVLNYRAAQLLKDLHFAGDGLVVTPMFLNDEGYWLSGPKPALEWSFMFGRANTFGDQYPSAWETIGPGDFGQFVSAQGLFTYTTVGLTDQSTSGTSKDPQHGHEAWKIVTLVPNSELGGFPRFSRNLPMYFVFLILLVIGSALLARKHVAYRFHRSREEFEQRFRAVLEHVNLAAMVLNADGRVSFCNPALRLGLKRRESEIINHEWVSLAVEEKSRDEARRRFGEFLNSDNDYHDEEAQVIDKEGNKRLIAWSHTVLSDVEGAPGALLCIGRDVTEERAAEMELLKVTQAVVQSPNTVMIVNRDGAIEYVNPKFTDLTGYEPWEVAWKKPSILKSGETDPEEYRVLWKTIVAGGTWTGVFHNRKKNGELYWEAARISGIRNQKGDITHFLAVKEDITERKRLEDTVRDKDSQIAKTEVFTAMGKMASMVAHDLRNPLSSIKMTLQILNRQGRKGGHEQDVELIQISLAQIGHMEETLEDLLAYSRPDALHAEWIDISKVLDAAINQVQKALHEHGVQLNKRISNGLPTLLGDAPKLLRVFMNLFLNSVQAMREGGTHDRRIDVITELRLEDGNPAILVTVIDNGRGVDPDTSKQLFEPFFTTRPEGSGLGLAIAKRIIDQHGGRIRFESPDDIGAAVTVLLPTGLSPVEKHP